MRTAGVGGRRHVYVESRAPQSRPARRQAKELRDASRNGESSAVERFARHHPSAPSGPFPLAAAQLVIARELRFASWPQRKAAVEARVPTPERRAEMFVTASVGRRPSEAEGILDAVLDIARYCLEAAACSP